MGAMSDLIGRESGIRIGAGGGGQGWGRVRADVKRSESQTNNPI